jgi:hypothetical protein
MAGGSVRGGMSYPERRGGPKVARKPVLLTCTTVLRLLGIDHTRLTYRHNGIDRRLTDVHGQVIRELMA